MIEFAFPFTRDRFTHRLLERTGAVCLVERENLVTGSTHWEVVVLREQPDRPGPDDTQLPASERYPSTNDWGRFGWTYTDVREAQQKYRSLCAPKAERGGSEAKADHTAVPPVPAASRRGRRAGGAT